MSRPIHPSIHTYIHTYASMQCPNPHLKLLRDVPRNCLALPIWIGGQQDLQRMGSKWPARSAEDGQQVASNTCRRWAAGGQQHLQKMDSNICRRWAAVEHGPALSSDRQPSMAAGRVQEGPSQWEMLGHTCVDPKHTRKQPSVQCAGNGTALLLRLAHCSLHKCLSE